jgi:hypothetical protein
MIWATPDEVRGRFAAYQAALGEAEWPPLPEADAAVQVLIESASRHLGTKVIRWPILDDDDRVEDEQDRVHVELAVCEVIRARLQAKVADDAATAQLGPLAGVVAGGGRVKAGSLEVQGGGSSSTSSSGRVPLDAIMCLQAAGLIGGSVPTW